MRAQRKRRRRATLEVRGKTGFERISAPRYEETGGDGWVDKWGNGVLDRGYSTHKGLGPGTSTLRIRGNFWKFGFLGVDLWHRSKL